MATTFIDLNGDGNNNKAFSFASYQVGDIVVEVDNVIKTVTTHYNVTNYTTSGGGTIVFTSGNIPASGSTIRISRDTDVDSAKATYQAGSSVKAGDLNNNQTQVLYALQEEQNQTITTARIKDGAVTSAKISDGTIVNADVSATAAIVGSKLVASSGSVAGSMSSAHWTKLEGIEASATADQSNAEIRAAVEAATDSNVFTDADHSKLNAIEASATADQTAAEIRTLVDSATDSNVFTDTQNTFVNAITSSAAELNYSTNVTSDIQTQLNAKQASDAELTELATMHTDTASALADLSQAEVQILDGATVSTTELNKLDGVTASATDLNIVASMTKQTTISDQDTSYPTSGAVVDYVAAQIAPIGGLEVIATDAAFPNTQPSSGVVISIADAGGLVVNGSGVSTTGRTVGASTVTINGINSSFHSTTIDAGIGMLVTSTGSGQIYDYHKTVIKESDVAQISDDINDFNSRYRIASSAPGSANDEGDLYFDTGTNKMYVYDGSAWGEVTSTGDFKYLVPCAFNTGTGNAAVFDGSISKYDLRENSTSGSLASVTNAAQLMVSVNGVVQKPNTGTSIGSNDGFCLVDGHTIEFGANLPSSSEVFVIQSGSALSINVIGDGTVTEAKLNVSNSPTNGYYLQAQSGAGGGLTWAAVSQYTTPLTTRGDILFRDASGDQRLAKGTDGQYLKIGANDPVWADVVGAVADGCIFENDQTISNNYTIASGKGAHSVGPITVNATVTVNGVWVIS